MNMESAGERTPRDIADGYLLLMLSKGSTGANNNAEKEGLASDKKGEPRSSPARSPVQSSSQAPQAIEALKEQERQLQEKMLRDRQLFEYLRSQNEESLRVLYPSGHSLANGSPGSLLGYPSADLRRHYLNLTANTGNHLSYRMGNDELHQQGLFQDQVRAALDEAAANQLRLLRPLTTLDRANSAERVNVCTPPVPSSPVASRNGEAEDSSSSSLPMPSSDKIPLPQWFKESKTTVVIGKGHLPRKTPGNQLLRQMVGERLQAYREANRRGRAIIVSDIYSAFQNLNPDGRYFGNFTDDGEWCEAKEHSARDKIAATFRDFLSHLYKSSTKSKVAKRRKRKAERARKDANE